MQMLRGHRNCPAYSKLKDADKTTVEYQRIVAENEVYFNQQQHCPSGSSDELCTLCRVSLLRCKDTLD